MFNRKAIQNKAISWISITVENLKTTSDSQKMTITTKRKNWSIGCVGSCSFSPVDCEAKHWLRQGQNMSKKRKLPITEIMLAIIYIDRVLSSLGCLTEKQPKTMQLFQYQSMLNSTKNHKWFSENGKNINETEKFINWLRRFVFFLSSWLCSQLLAAPRPKDEQKKEVCQSRKSSWQSCKSIVCLVH